MGIHLRCIPQHITCTVLRAQVDVLLWPDEVLRAARVGSGGGGGAAVGVAAVCAAARSAKKKATGQA